MKKQNILLSPTLKKLNIFFLILACSACSSEKRGLDELKRLCEKDAGLTIYKSVEADGYYDTTRKGGALGLLIPSEFSFTEYCNFEPNIASLFNEPGCWRLIKVSRKKGQCNEAVDNILFRYNRIGYAGFRETNCIAVGKIEKPMARYSYQSDFKKWYSNNEVSKFTRSDVYIKSDLTNEILGRYVSYSYNVRPGHSIAKSCEIFKGDYPSFKESNLISAVIQPSQGVDHD